MLHRSLSDKFIDYLNVLLLAVIAATMLFPFLYIFSVSFSTYADYLTSKFILWPKTWTLETYRFIISSDRFVQAMLVTVYITTFGTLMNLLFTSTMAYGLTRKIIGQKPVIFIVLISALFSGGLIPTYLVVKATGLLDSIWALIIPGAIAPFNLIIMRQFFLNIPGELIESGLIDGANEVQIFTRIILPLSKPALAAFGLFYAVGHWNSYFSAIIYINDPAKWPIQVLLRQMILEESSTGALGEQFMRILNPPPAETIQMAAILLANAPILVLYPFLQKHFAKGVMLGSIKG